MSNNYGAIKSQTIMAPLKGGIKDFLQALFMSKLYLSFMCHILSYIRHHKCNIICEKVWGIRIKKVNSSASENAMQAVIHKTEDRYMYIYLVHIPCIYFVDYSEHSRLDEKLV